MQAYEAETSSPGAGDNCLSVSKHPFVQADALDKEFPGAGECLQPGAERRLDAAARHERAAGREAQSKFYQPGAHLTYTFCSRKIAGHLLMEMVDAGLAVHGWFSAQCLWRIVIKSCDF